MYYFEGVGVRAENFGQSLERAILATDIEDRCVEAYAAIVRHYSPGSNIWLFGFSRGAFTVRSVAGMINNLGVLREAQGARCGEVYHHYRDRSDDWNPTVAVGIQNCEQFRTDYSHSRSKTPPIRCCVAGKKHLRFSATGCVCVLSHSAL